MSLSKEATPRRRSLAREWSRLLLLVGIVTYAESAWSEFDTVITVPPDTITTTITAGTQLNILEGATVTRGFSVDGGEVNILGGSLWWGLHATGNSVVNVSGGQVSGSLHAQFGAEVNLTGGSSRVQATDGSTVNVAGGSGYTSIAASRNSTVNVLAGARGVDIDVSTGSTLNFLDGQARSVDLESGSRVDMQGGTTDRLNLSGSTAEITGGSLRSVSADKQSDILVSGGSIGYFFDVDASRVMISGGSMEGLDLGEQSVATVTGGTFSRFIDVREGSTLTIVNGQFGDSIYVKDASVRLDGGTIEGAIVARSGGGIQITGGEVGGVTAEAGSDVDISAGNMGRLVTRVGSTVDIRGGAFGGEFNYILGGGNITLHGQFYLNGDELHESGVELAPTDVLSGILEDGTPFIFSPVAMDDMAGVTLAEVPVPDSDLTPIVITGESSPAGVRSGQSLLLVEGGRLPRNFAAIGAELHITGGEVGDSLEVLDSTVNISGAQIGDDFTAYDKSVVVISRGTIGQRFTAATGSRVDIVGGVFSDYFNALEGSHVSLYGGEFLVNGAVPASSVVTLSGADVLTGTLASGEAVLFTPRNGDRLTGVKLVEVPVPVADLAPLFLDGDRGPHSLRNGQSLTLGPDGVLPDDFNAVGATLNLSGGHVGARLAVAESTVTVSGAVVDQQLTLHQGSVLTMTEGEIGGFSRAWEGSEVNISGGTLGRTFITSGAVVNVSGGVIGPYFVMRNGEINVAGGRFVGGLEIYDGVLNISAGSFGDRVRALNHSQINVWGSLPGAGVYVEAGGEWNLFGTEFLLDGVPIDPRRVGKSFEIDARNVTLSGVLADGSSFSMFLALSNADYLLAPGARLTITFVPEPATCCSMAVVVALASLTALKRRAASPCPTRP